MAEYTLVRHDFGFVRMTAHLFVHMLIRTTPVGLNLLLLATVNALF